MNSIVIISTMMIKGNSSFISTTGDILSSNDVTLCHEYLVTLVPLSMRSPICFSSDRCVTQFQKSYVKVCFLTMLLVTRMILVRFMSGKENLYQIIQYSECIIGKLVIEVLERKKEEYVVTRNQFQKPIRARGTGESDDVTKAQEPWTQGRS